MRDGPRLGYISGLDRVIGVPASADLVAQHLAALDGWGLRPTVEFFLQGPIDPATVPETTSALTDSVFVLEVDPETAEKGAPLQYDWRYDADRNVIVGSPAMGVQLRENTRYAAVLTTDVRNADGVPVFSSYNLGLLGQDPPERWKTSGEAYEELLGLPELKDRIASVAVFTTQDASAVLRKGRNQIANVAAVPAPVVTFGDPALIFDSPDELDALLGTATRETTGPRTGLEHWGADNPTGIAHDHVGVVATGTLNTARFIGDDTGTNGPEDETFEIGIDGVPNVRSIIDIPITFVLPKGPVPATGFPVVIFGHGLGRSRHDVLNLAEPLASQGYAVVAIDVWGHGSRYDATDDQNNLAAKPDFTGDPTLHDGFGDPRESAFFDFFHEFQNFSAVRDAVRQSVLDLSRVALLLKTNPTLEALAGPYSTTPALDTRRIAFLGESFGAIMGTDLAAIEPNVGLYVLDVPGGGIVDYAVPNGAEYGELTTNFGLSLYRIEGKFDRFHPVNSMMQAIIDAADSLTYARHVFRDRLTIEGKVLDGRSVVALEVMNDESIPNVSTEALARGLGLQVLRPNVAPPDGMLQIESPGRGNVAAQTGILVQYEPATHGANWNSEHGTIEYVPGYPHEGSDPYPKLPAPITIDEPIYETQAQVAEILQTYFAGMLPLVRSTIAPVADFDGDGVPDGADPSPYDPTK
jgi:dienelactone hydrolase